MEEKKEKKEESKINVQLTKTTLWQIISGILGLLLFVSIVTGGFGIKSGEGSATVKLPSPTQPTAPSAPVGDIVKVSVDDDPYKGKDNAPVIMIEFSDFQCPFCGRFYSQTLKQIEDKYIKTGKVKFVYRDFPLSFHPQAQKAAEAGECADEQGKFWEMHDKIFENQALLSDTIFSQWASDIGLDTNKFNNCLDSGKYAQEVQKDLNDGQSYGVSGTPTFFINGKRIVGAQPYSAFEAAIEAEL